MLNNVHSSLVKQRKNVHGPTFDKKYFSWGLDLQQPYQEADLFDSFNSRPFNQFPKNIENMAKVRTTGHLSITHNLDILRNTLWQAVRRNRGRKGVSSVLMINMHILLEQMFFRVLQEIVGMMTSFQVLDKTLHSVCSAYYLCII